VNQALSFTTQQLNSVAATQQLFQLTKYKLSLKNNNINIINTFQAALTSF